MKWRLPVLLLLLAVSAFGATLRLYLKDGSFQVVHEYQVIEDRVQYRSAERSVWEEIPVDLVDLDRTKKEAAEHEAELAKEAKEDAEELAAIRAQRREAASVPDDSGAYYVRDEMLEPLKQPDVTLVTDKGRSVLRGFSTIVGVLFGHAYPPVPLTSGKSTAEVEGAAATFRVTEDRPEFYLRLTGLDGLAIVKLTPKGNARVVETIWIAGVTNELEAKRETVPTFTRQVGDLLYKIWPEQPLPPGEYAVVEFRDGEGTLLVWDFGVGDL
ncbi:MAG TPA: hypothetical protein VGG72_14985 [Bryobacteraceae bacterium]|jgi:hypothetical protein